MAVWLKQPMPISKTGFALAYRTGVDKGPGFWFAVFLSLLSFVSMYQGEPLLGTVFVAPRPTQRVPWT